MLSIGSDRQQRLGLYSQAEVARLVGIDRATLHYQLKRNRVPKPTHRLGSRLFYTEAEVRHIVCQFEERLNLRTEPQQEIDQTSETVKP
jgi:predicted DNA-binding transcriptional regulator AlpA